MGSDQVDRAVQEVQARHPDLAPAVMSVADALTAEEGVDMIHQAALQRFLWWQLPRRYPEALWAPMVAATGALLDELGLVHLAEIGRSEATSTVLAAWGQGAHRGAAAARAAEERSGVEPPDTATLEWGPLMGPDELRAHDIVERALGEAVAARDLVPGGPRWRPRATAITEALLTRPLDLPPGQTLAGMVLTERLGTWIDAAPHPVHREWRSSVANRLLHPTSPPAGAGQAVGPMRWLLEHAAQPGGVELTQSYYLARTVVVEAAERFGWWPWEKPPRSEAELHQLSVLREAATRMRLLRRRGRRLHLTTRGTELLADPDRLWQLVSGETEDGEDFTRAVTEVVGLRLLRGRVEQHALVAEVTPILGAQGWASSAGPITVNVVASAVWRPLRWWRLFGAVDEEEARWEPETGRQVSPHTIALSPDGEAMVLTYLRARAAGPVRQLGG
jgi:hypothetical protein